MQPNEQLVASFLSQEQWDYFFPFADAIYTRDNFLAAIAKFPGFCGENYHDNKSDEEVCKREVANLFAHFAAETSYNSPWEVTANGIDLWRQALYFTHELGCGPGEAGNGTANCDYIDGDWQGVAWPAQEGKQYYGRGPFQLSYNSNYGQFSNVFVETKYDSKMDLLKDPELLLKDGYTSFAAALWFYMTPQNPKPSMHDVMTGLYTPNTVDTQAGIKGGFGSTINIINGGVECGKGGAEHVKATARGNYFIKFL